MRVAPEEMGAGCRKYAWVDVDERGMRLRGAYVGLMNADEGRMIVSGGETKGMLVRTVNEAGSLYAIETGDGRSSFIDRGTGTSSVSAGHGLLPLAVKRCRCAGIRSRSLAGNRSVAARSRNRVHAHTA